MKKYAPILPRRSDRLSYALMVRSILCASPQRPVFKSSSILQMFLIMRRDEDAQKCDIVCWLRIERPQDSRSCSEEDDHRSTQRLQGILHYLTTSIIFSFTPSEEESLKPGQQLSRKICLNNVAVHAGGSDACDLLRNDSRITSNNYQIQSS